MNLMKQKLDNSLSWLTLNPAQQAQIAEQAAAPRRARRGRGMVIALALTCLLGISVTAAVLQPRWNLAFSGNSMSARLQEPVLADLSPSQKEKLNGYFESHGCKGTFRSFDALEDGLGLSFLHSDRILFQEHQLDRSSTPSMIHYTAASQGTDRQGVSGYLLSLYLVGTYPLPYLDQTGISRPSYEACVSWNAQLSTADPLDWTVTSKGLGYRFFTSYTFGSITANVTYDADHTSAMALFEADGIAYYIDVNVPMVYADTRTALAEDVLYSILDSLE